MRIKNFLDLPVSSSVTDFWLAGVEGGSLLKFARSIAASIEFRCCERCRLNCAWASSLKPSGRPRTAGLLFRLSRRFTGIAQDGCGVFAGFRGGDDA